MAVLPPLLEFIQAQSCKCLPYVPFSEQVLYALFLQVIGL
jgi:hypothetical protein